MKLKQIIESFQNIHNFYKGMTLSNYKRFKEHRIPGFLADLEMALIYSSPETMPIKEPVVLIEVPVDIDAIEDMRDEIDDMCGAWQDRAKAGAPPEGKEDKPRHETIAGVSRDGIPTYKRCTELRKKIWWSTSGGHGMRGIYYGLPIDSWRVLFVADGPEEWRAASAMPEIQKILNRYPKDEVDEAADSILTWRDFL